MNEGIAVYTALDWSRGHELLVRLFRGFGSSLWSSQTRIRSSGAGRELRCACTDAHEHRRLGEPRSQGMDMEHKSLSPLQLLTLLALIGFDRTLSVPRGRCRDSHESVARKVMATSQASKVKADQTAAPRRPAPGTNGGIVWLLILAFAAAYVSRSRSPSSG